MPPTSTRSPPKVSKAVAAIECDDCGVAFSRTSHLIRHREQHASEGDRIKSRCDVCGSSFSRKDVLLRHQKTAHKPRQTSHQSVRKSCVRCVRHKLRCTRTHPCNSCSKKGAECTYFTAGSAFPELCGGSPSLLVCSDYQLMDNGGGPDSECSRNGLQAMAVSNSSSQQISQRQLESLGLPEPTNSTFVDSTCLLEASKGMEEGRPPQWPLPVLSTSDFDFGCLDWLNFDMASPTEDRYVPPPRETRLADVQTPIPQMSPQASSSVAPARVRSALLSPELRRNHVRGTESVSLLGDVQGHQPVSHDSRAQWPFDYSSDHEHRTIQLPPLRQMLLATNITRHPMNNSMVSSLIEMFSSAYLPRIDEGLNPHLMSALTILTRYLDLYISEFHSILPLIHIPTWGVSSCPTILLAAMACIGALFSDEEGSLELSWSLSEISLQTLSWLGESDSTNSRDPVYVSACCLHQIYSLGSGNRRLYESADGSRGFLMTRLRGMGLLRPSLSSGEGEIRSEPSTPCINGSANEFSKWIGWRNVELAKRITWSAFEYDCSLCTLTSRRGAVDLHELPDRLPCAENLWDAPSARAWSMLMSSTRTPANGLCTSQVLRAIFTQQPISDQVSGWGKRVCAQIIGRLLWDLHRLERVSTLGYLGLPSLTTAHKPTKEVLLNCLSNLSASMSRPSSLPDLIHLNIMSLICHYSHLYTSDEAMDLVMFIFRGTAQDKKSRQTDSELESAKSRLQHVFAQNPQETRAMVWHAAQIIGVAKEYFIHAPCETMRVFMGHIFLLAYSRYGPDAHQRLPAGRYLSCARLDRQHSTAAQKSAIRRWIKLGGAASVCSVEDITNIDRLGALKLASLQMMREMRVWGLAKKFCKVLEGFDID